MPRGVAWLIAALILIVVGAGLTFSFSRQAELRRGSAEWDAEVARIRESGDPLTGAELHAFYAIPEGEEDLTPLYVKALAGCDTDFKAAGDLPIVGSNDDDIPIPPQTWPQLEQAEAFLEQYQVSLRELHEAGERRGAVRYPVDLHDQLSPASDHVMSIRAAMRLLVLQRACQMHRADYRGAADSVIAIHRLAATLSQEPTGFGQLVRAALAGIAHHKILDTVRDPAFPAEELQRLQELLSESDWRQSYYLCCLSERALIYERLQRPISVTWPNAEKEFRIAPGFVLLHSRPADAAKVLTFSSDYVDAARGELPTLISSYQFIVSRVHAWADELKGELPRGGKRRNTTAENIAPSFLINQSPHTFLRAAAEERAAIAVLAIERYRRQRGELPDTLDDLVPDYLAAVPADPCDGHPLRFVKRRGGYAVYSVGMDLVDQLGQVESSEERPKADEGLFVPAREAQ